MCRLLNTDSLIFTFLLPVSCSFWLLEQFVFRVSRCTSPTWFGRNAGVWGLRMLPLWSVCAVTFFWAKQSSSVLAERLLSSHQFFFVWTTTCSNLYFRSITDCSCFIFSFPNNICYKLFYSPTLRFGHHLLIWLIYCYQVRRAQVLFFEIDQNQLCLYCKVLLKVDLLVVFSIKTWSQTEILSRLHFRLAHSCCYVVCCTSHSEHYWDTGCVPHMQWPLQSYHPEKEIVRCATRLWRKEDKASVKVLMVNCCSLVLQQGMVRKGLNNKGGRRRKEWRSDRNLS